MADRGGSGRQRTKSRSSDRPKSQASKPSSGKSRKGSPARSRSRSPPKSASLSRASTAKSRRTLSAKSDKSVDKKVRLRSAELNAKGLKIVDMSSQGMTGLPSSLFSRKDVGDLDLSGNNLRSLPPDIRRLTTLTLLDLSKNGIRCTRPEDYSGLPRDMQQLRNLEILIISECNLAYIPPVIWKLTSLRHLDVSRNKINILMPEIGNLMRLKHLNLQQTNISTLPPEIAFCQDLEELLLWGNVIETLPETLREMPVLRVFALNYRSFCTLVDSYMENLLKKGQIQSEHIPPVLFEIPALEKLDLESTKINCLPESFSDAMQELYINKNFFLKFPVSVFTIQSLKVLDISHNDIAEVPVDISKLRCLTCLRMDYNALLSLPGTIGQLEELEELSCSNNKLRMLPNGIGHLKKLKSLVLENNEIKALPDTICDLVGLTTLDLTGNHITALPVNFHQLKNLAGAHTYDKLRKHGLWLHKNPLKSPPPQVWKTDNPTFIFQHLKKMQIVQTKDLQRQKLYLLGEHQCGKTSLLNAMISGKSSLTDGITDSTPLLNYTVWRTENKVQFIVHDFGGAEVYKILHPLFLDGKAIFLIVYDHRKYTEQNHFKAIGYWLDLLQTYTPGAVVKIVGTQCDLCYSDFIDKTLQSVKDRIIQQLEGNRLKLQETLEFYQRLLVEDDRSHSAGQLKEQCQRIQHLLDNPLKYDGQIVLVNAAEGIAGIPELVTDIEVLAVNKELFGHAQRYIPEKWLKFKSQLKLQKEHYLHREEVKDMADKLKITGSNFQSCLQYLFDIGEILIFPSYPVLKDLVFHRTRHLVEIITGLFQHSLEVVLDFDQNKTFRSKGLFTREVFTLSRQNLLQFGFISRQMLQCLWFYLQFSYDDFNTMTELVPCFDLCYSIPQPEQPPPRYEQSPLLVVPYYNRDPSPTNKDDLWPKESQLYTQVSTSFTFPLHLPHGLFERFLCRIQDKLLSRIDYRDASVAETDKGFFMAHCALDENSYDIVINVAVRSSDGGYARSTAMEFKNVISSLLQDSPGAVWHVCVSTTN